MSQGFNISRLRVRVPEGKEENLKVSGRLLYVEEANQGFRITTDSGDRAYMKAGRKIALGETTNNVRVINDGAGDLVCTLAYGYGDIKDSAVTGEISIKAAAYLNPLTPVTLLDGASYTIPGNSNRRKLTLFCDQDNIGQAWLSDTAGSGVPLVAGAIREIEITGALTITASGGAVTVYADEVV